MATTPHSIWNTMMQLMRPRSPAHHPPPPHPPHPPPPPPPYPPPVPMGVPRSSNCSDQSSACFKCRMGDNNLKKQPDCHLHCTGDERAPRNEAAYERPVTWTGALSVALVISGTLDHHWKGASFQAKDIVPRLRENVIQPLIDAHPKNAVHSFLCVEPATLPKNMIPDDFTYSSGQPNWSHLVAGRSQVLVVPKDAFLGVDVQIKDMHQWERIESCYLAARAFEGQLLPKAVAAVSPLDWLLPTRSSMQNASFRGLRFTHFVRMRPDLQWRQKIPLASFEAVFLHVRSRDLLFADECAVAHDFSIAFPPCRAEQVMRSEQVMEGRELMKEASIDVCAALDDMLAVMPEHLADAYFLRTQTLRQRVPKFMPYGWDAKSRQAIRMTYGPQGDPVLYSALCKRARNRFMGSGRPEDERPHQPTDEHRSTSRIIGRMLPFRISPFGFAEMWYPQHQGCNRQCQIRHSTMYC